MLRAEDSEYFDKWSNASYEAFYDTVDDFINRALIDLEEKMELKIKIKEVKEE